MRQGRHKKKVLDGYCDVCHEVKHDWIYRCDYCRKFVHEKCATIEKLKFEQLGIEGTFVFCDAVCRDKFKKRHMEPEDTGQLSLMEG